MEQTQEQTIQKLNKLELEAVKDNIVAIPLSGEVKSETGLIVMTETYESSPEIRKALVYKVGPDVTQVSEGDVICFPKAPGWSVSLWLEDIFIIRESSVLITIKNGNQYFN